MLHDAVLAAAPVLVILALVFGPVAAWLAARQGRNPAIWLGFGALIGPLAAAILLVSPPARCPRCAEPTAGFETRCDACGFDLESRAVVEAPVEPAPLAAALGSVEHAGAVPVSAPILRSLPGPGDVPSGAARRAGGRRSDRPGDAQPARLSAVGAHRPATGPTIAGTILDGSHQDVTLLAMGVLVLGADPLKTGSRYVLARTRDRLLIIGPIEAADEHVEFGLPLSGIEANFVADRLVISAISEDRSHRTLVIAFQSVASLTGKAVDEAIMEPPDPYSLAAAQP